MHKVSLVWNGKSLEMEVEWVLAVLFDSWETGQVSFETSTQLRIVK